MGFVFSAITTERQRQAFIFGCSLAVYMALSALLEASLLLNDSVEMAQKKFVQQTFIDVPYCRWKRHRAAQWQSHVDALSD